MDTAHKVAALEALLERVMRNAAEPRPARVRAAVSVAPAEVAPEPVLPRATPQPEDLDLLPLVDSTTPAPPASKSTSARAIQAAKGALGTAAKPEPVPAQAKPDAPTPPAPAADARKVEQRPVAPTLGGGGLERSRTNISTGLAGSLLGELAPKSARAGLAKPAAKPAEVKPPVRPIEAKAPAAPAATPEPKPVEKAAEQKPLAKPVEVKPAPKAPTEAPAQPVGKAAPEKEASPPPPAARPQPAPKEAAAPAAATANAPVRRGHATLLGVGIGESATPKPAVGGPKTEAKAEAKAEPPKAEPPKAEPPKPEPLELASTLQAEAPPPSEPVATKKSSQELLLEAEPAVEFDTAPRVDGEPSAPEPAPAPAPERELPAPEPVRAEGPLAPEPPPSRREKPSFDAPDYSKGEATMKRRPPPPPPPEEPPAGISQSRSGGVILGLVAAGLVGGGIYLGLKQGWLGGDSPPHVSVSAATSAPPQPRSAPPAPSGAPPPTAPPSASVPAPPSASAALSASASAASAAVSASAPPGPGDDAEAAALPFNKGLLVITATESLDVYVHGVRLGKTGQKLTATCGDKHIRLGKIIGQAPTGADGAAEAQVQWRSEGKSYSIACKKLTTLAITVQ